MTVSPSDGSAPKGRVMRRRLGYRPGLDGLRAVAVGAVMLFHGGLSWIPGGFLGVDLFFVLSGFLITTLLLEEWGTTGKLRLGLFWGRRARRLFPALAVVLLAVSVYGATLAPADTRPGLRWDGLASLFYVANWRFVFGHQPYFATFGVPSPLRHLWSLAVEEQWYLIWPPTLSLLMLVMQRRRVPPKRKLEMVLVLLGALTLASAGQMLRLDLVTHGAADSGRSYYGTDTHIQVLLVGAMLAVGWLRWPPNRQALQRLWRAGGLAGAGACTTMFFVVQGSDRWMYRGGFALFAVAGALVVAGVVVDNGGVLARALSVAPLRAVGRVSYGLYLWHWPIDVCLNPTRVHLGTYPLFFLRTAVAAAAATLSYRYVEMPIRTKRLALRRPWQLGGATVAILTAGLLLLPSVDPAVATGVVGTAPSSATAPLSPPLKASAPPVSTPGASPTSSTVPGVVPGKASTLIPPIAPGQPVRVLMVGDSVGLSLTNGVAAPPPLLFANASIEGCGVTFGAAIVDGYPIYDTSQCPADKQRQAWLAGLATKPDVVVMSFGTWEVFDQEYDNHDYKVFSDDYRTLLTQQLQSDINFITTAGNIHIVLLDVPCYHEDSYGLGGSSSARNDPARVAWVNQVFSSVAAANPGRVTMVPISQWACPGGTFLSQRNGIVLRPDGVHYDPESAALTWSAWLGPQVLSLAQRPARVPDPPARVPDPPAGAARGQAPT